MKKVTLYRLATYERGPNRYIPIEGGNKPVGGRNPKGGKLGSYYLRYRAGETRKWESVGDDYAVALQEQRHARIPLTPQSPSPSSRRRRR